MILAEPRNHEEWIKAREAGIGGSEAACILGMNKYKTNVTLWKEKKGLVKPEDVSEKPAVRYGKEAEAYIRNLFQLDYPEYEVSYNEFRMYASDEHPFIFATLDGELTDKETGARGILEIKTATIQNSLQWNNWQDDEIPENYYIQILHQLAATGWDFVILRAYIKYHRKGRLFACVKDYKINRNEVSQEIDFLITAEERFWKSLERDDEPAQILPKI
ncbi:MAG: YqaJ viral recombinase family protein [Oscillospiraceae bacterium]|nr:YqaJ viral recombinase family protein [Oscillospiraceae bacterium]